MRSQDFTIVEEFVTDRQGLPDDTPEVEHTAENEPMPEFPRIPGPIGALLDAITPDLSYDHKALAALTYFGLALSGKARIKSEPFLQPRFYACSVGLPGTGKSAADKEVSRALLPLMPAVRAELSIDSGPALVEVLVQHPLTIYRPDELAEAFEKAKVTSGSRNSLFGEFLRLYESNETGHAVIERNGGSVSITDAHFAIYGSATKERFDRIWQGSSGGASGLQSRFVLSYSERPLPPIKTGNDEEKLATAQTALAAILERGEIYVRLSDEAQEKIIWWTMEADRGRHTRLLDMAKRFALIVAVTCGEDTITGDVMGLGLKFADHQMALYEKLMPDDAANFVQAFENKILGYFGKHPSKTARECRNWIKPEKCPGGFGAFNQAFGNLQKANALVAVGRSRKGTPLWSADIES
jgi:hypothetical protein